MTTPAIPRPRTRAAIIGCGAIAAEHLKFLGSSSLVELAAVCDVSNASADFTRSRYGAGAAFVDSSAMLAQVRPAVVHVLTPPHTHAALVTACLDAGCHVVCEKPMTGSASETVALLMRARECGLVLVESHNYLYNDIVLRIDKWIADGRLGEIVEIDLMLSLNFLPGPLGDTNLAGPSVRLPGGAVHDFLPHLAYLFLHFAGHRGEVDDVRGYFGNLSGNRRAVFDHLDALVHAGVKRGRLRIATDGHPDMFRLTIRGTLGTVETDLFNPYFRFDGSPNIGKRASLGQLRNGAEFARAGARNLRDKILQHGTYHGLPRMLDEIYRAIRDGVAPKFGDDKMIDSARLIDRLVQLKDAA